MRSTSEMSKRGKARKRWNDLGFFVVWMGIVGGTIARIAAQSAGLDGHSLFKAIVCGIVIPSAVTFYGLIVRG